MERNRIIENHVIITHCNLEGFDVDDIYKGNPSWMEYRLDMFEKYTLTSLMNQTDPGFHLLMFCHTNTPPSFYNSIKNAYIEVRNNDSDDIICSRMGTDDMVEVRFNEIIKSLTQQVNTISIAGGLYWDVITDEFLHSMFPTGPFVSVKSTLTDFKGDMREISHHHLINQTQGSFIMNEDPLWIQLCSGTNVWNALDKMPGEKIEHPGGEFLEINFGFKK